MTEHTLGDILSAALKDARTKQQVEADTYNAITNKMKLYWEAGYELRRAKAELEYQKVAVRAHEQELAQMFLNKEGLDWIDREQLYLIGRQIAKALPKPIG